MSKSYREKRLLFDATMLRHNGASLSSKQEHAHGDDDDDVVVVRKEI